jgi:hypothetical protein
MYYELVNKLNLKDEVNFLDNGSEMTIEPIEQVKTSMIITLLDDLEYKFEERFKNIEEKLIIKSKHDHDTIIVLK